MKLSDKILTPKQQEILEILFKGPILQNKLQNHLKVTGSTLFYHLSKLDKAGLIQKKTIQQIGNAKINEICLQPVALQYIRQLLKIQITKYTLVTGFGSLSTGYKIPYIIDKLLRNRAKGLFENKLIH